MTDPAPPPPKRLFSALGITLILFLGLVFLAVLVAGNIGAPSSEAPFGPLDATAGPAGPFHQAANAFLLDLKAGRLEAAYERTTKEFRQRQTLDQFQASWNNHPFPGLPGSRMSSQKEIKPGAWNYLYRATGPNGSWHLTFDVAKEGELYRVTSLTIE